MTLRKHIKQVRRAKRRATFSGKLYLLNWLDKIERTNKHGILGT